MKVFVAVFILAFVESSFAAASGSAKDICANCIYNDGIGYVGDDNCHVFHQCIKYGDSSVKEIPHCCPKGTKWVQSYLSCVVGKCDDPIDVCPDGPTTTDRPCPFKPDPSSPFKFIDKLTHIALDCPAYTIYNEKYCSCVLGGNKTCDDDPLLFFPFAHHFNDIQCHKVIGTPYGDAELVTFDRGDGGYVRLDGKNSFVGFHFLNNWFALWKKVLHFTVSVWFRQTDDGWFNLNNHPIEGIFGNGDCKEDPSIWITFGNTTLQGGMRKSHGKAEFTDDDEDKPDRFYFGPNEWCLAAIRSTGKDVCMFLNGKLVGCREIKGYVLNTHSPATIGMAYFGCVPFFFTGCMDDFMVFNRYVGNAEQLALFERFRTGPWSEDPY